MKNFAKFVKIFLSNITIIFLSFCLSLNPSYSFPTKINPEMEFLDSKKNIINFEKFEDKIIILHFWATWCQTCGIGLAKLDRLQKEYKKQPVEIIALSEDFKDIFTVEGFYTNYNIKNLKIYIDNKNKIFKQLNISSVPSTIVLDQDYNVVYTFAGDISKELDNIKNSVYKILNKK